MVSELEGWGIQRMNGKEMLTGRTPHPVFPGPLCLLLALILSSQKLRSSQDTVEALFTDLPERQSGREGKGRRERGEEAYLTVLWFTLPRLTPKPGARSPFPGPRGSEVQGNLWIAHSSEP